MRAIWNGTVIAESDKTVVVEGNHYFPPGSLVAKHFRENLATTACPWKGTANYFDVVVGARSTNAPPGSTRRQKKPPGTSLITSHFGGVLK